jgi:hypothetical protein
VSKRHAVKTHWGVKVKIHTFVTLAVDRGDLYHLAAFHPVNERLVPTGYDGDSSSLLPRIKFLLTLLSYPGSFYKYQ